MESYLLGISSAIWFGILTSISPCPLATNIAAISFIGKRVSSPRLVVMSGLLYMFGRMLAYLVLGYILVASILSIPDLSYFLQENMNKLLGHLLLIVGVFLLELLPLSLPRLGINQNIQHKVSKMGIWGAGILGLVFALSFCPVSAALFFGSLIPLAVKHDSNFVMPLVYGIGTALPVMLFAFLVGFGTTLVGKFFNRIKIFEIWARRITGVVFIVVGLYYSVTYLLNVNIW